jgi:hypothetical protein
MPVRHAADSDPSAATSRSWRRSGPSLTVDPTGSCGIRSTPGNSCPHSGLRLPSAPRWHSRSGRAWSACRYTGHSGRNKCCCRPRRASAPTGAGRRRFCQGSSDGVDGRRIAHNPTATGSTLQTTSARPGARRAVARCADGGPESSGVEGLGLALPGSLIQRRVRCGRATCRCHAGRPPCTAPTGGGPASRPARPSPGWSDEQVEDYRHWLGNHRRLRQLVAELEDLTLTVADRPPGTIPAPAEPGKPSDKPDADPLTRGRRHPTRASPQVKAKREGLTGSDLGLCRSRSFLCPFAPREA